MNAHATSSTSKTAGAHDCGCGCGGGCGCQSQCCELECLVRPNFYCGQLLTDVDLDALVEWTRSRFALTRYRDGWGVVCGLNLTCSPLTGARTCCGDPAKGPVVYVKPGYAIDCCGNDLVVCDPIAVDLNGMCRPEDDPCAPPTRAAAAQSKTQGWMSVSKEWQSCLGEGEVMAVDLFLRYHEDLSHGQRPLFGGKCGDDRSCEYARVLERPCVHATPAVDAAQLPDPAAEFKKKQDEAMAAIGAAVAGGARGIRDYLRQHPIGQLCFIENLRCCHADAEGRTRSGTEEARKKAAEELAAAGEDLRRWLFHDWFQQYLECDCGSCKPDNGVPIGRVYLFRPSGDKAGCQVLMIDPGEPYRRPLSKDPCGLPDTGRYDLRRYYGMPAARAESALADEGFTVSKKRVELHAAEALPDRRFEWTSGPGAIDLHVASDPLGIERVIALTKP